MATVDDFFDEVRKLNKQAKKEGKAVKIERHDDGSMSAEIVDKKVAEGCSGYGGITMSDGVCVNCGCLEKYHR